MDASPAINFVFFPPKSTYTHNIKSTASYTYIYSMSSRFNNSYSEIHTLLPGVPPLNIVYAFTSRSMDRRFYSFCGSVTVVILH